MQSAPKMREYGAEIVPIGLHVDYFDHLVYRLLLLQGFEQRICGETAGASFGGEQLDENRLARARRRALRGQREEKRRAEKQFHVRA